MSSPIREPPIPIISLETSQHDISAAGDNDKSAVIESPSQTISLDTSQNSPSQAVDIVVSQTGSCVTLDEKAVVSPTGSCATVIKKVVEIVASQTGSCVTPTCDNMSLEIPKSPTLIIDLEGSHDGDSPIPGDIAFQIEGHVAPQNASTNDKIPDVGPKSTVQVDTLEASRNKDGATTKIAESPTASFDEFTGTRGDSLIETSFSQTSTDTSTGSSNCSCSSCQKSLMSQNVGSMSSIPVNIADGELSSTPVDIATRKFCLTRDKIGSVNVLFDSPVMLETTDQKFTFTMPVILIYHLL